MYRFWHGSMSTTDVSTRESIIHTLSPLPDYMKSNIATSLLHTTSTAAISHPPASYNLQPGWFISDLDRLRLQRYPEGTIATVSYEKTTQSTFKSNIITYGRYKSYFKSALHALESSMTREFHPSMKRQPAESPKNYLLRIAETLNISDTDTFSKVGDMIEHAFYGYEEPNSDEWREFYQSFQRINREIKNKKDTIKTGRKVSEKIG